MSPELDRKLCEEFPSIFRNRTADMRESCMRWGFECGDGWYNIIRGLCLTVTYNYKTSKDLKLDGRVLPEGTEWDDPEWDSYFWDHTGAGVVVAAQVKEKFGTLRFYYHGDWSDEDRKKAELYPHTARIIAEEQRRFVDGAVGMAETMSSITCEETGLPGVLHSTGGGRGGWLKTLNPDFAKNNEWCKSRSYAIYGSVE
jgi:hypothetical protein